MFTKGIRQTDIVDKTGIDHGSVSSYVNGRYMPNAEKMAKIAAALGVSVNYLLGKEDVSYADLLPKPPVMKEPFIYGVDDEEAKIIEAYRKADETQRRLVAYVLGLKDAAEGP